MSFNHSWEDVSYHGSPIYECEFCGCSKRSKEAALSCPKAEEVLKRRADKKEQQERWEYKRMLDKIERFKYLEEKYGEKKTEDHNLIHILD